MSGIGLLPTICYITFGNFRPVNPSSRIPNNLNDLQEETPIFLIKANHHFFWILGGFGMFWRYLWETSFGRSAFLRHTSTSPTHPSSSLIRRANCVTSMHRSCPLSSSTKVFGGHPVAPWCFSLKIHSSTAEYVLQADFNFHSSFLKLKNLSPKIGGLTMVNIDLPNHHVGPGRTISPYGLLVRRWDSINTSH